MEILEVTQKWTRTILLVLALVCCVKLHAQNSGSDQIKEFLDPYHCFVDSALFGTSCDSVDYRLSCMKEDEKCQNMDLSFNKDNLHINSRSYSPYLLFSIGDSIQTHTAVRFYEDYSKIKQVYQKEGMVVTDLLFHQTGQMLSYFKCDYSKCDQCILERYNYGEGERYSLRIELQPISCNPDFNASGALLSAILSYKVIPIRVIELLDNVEVRSKVVSLVDFYSNSWLFNNQDVLEYLNYFQP